VTELDVRSRNISDIPVLDARVATALGITILTWGSAFAAIRIALHAFDPGEMALLRLSFASAGLAIYAVATRMRLPAVRDLPAIFLLGFLGFGFYNTALNYGELTVQAGVASLLIATAPIFTALFAVVFLKERLGPRGWLGILTAFAGVVLIVAGQQGSFGISRGAFFILSAALSVAIYFVAQRPLLKRYSPLELTTYSIWSGTVLIVFYLPRLVGECHTATWQMIAAVAYLGVFPAALGFVLWNYAMSRLTVSRISSFLYLVPVAAMTGGWLMLREIPTALSLCGGPVAVAGVFLVNTRKRNLSSSPAGLSASADRTCP
jgi:drug/metabolite transporter (DMT)-like permease